MKTVAELQADPRTAKAEIRLKKAGFTDAWWLGLLNHMVALPTRHAQINQETKAEARLRREALGIKMRGLATAIANDIEASDFYPHYRGGDWKYPVLRIGRPHDQALSLGGWLTECAEHLEAGGGSYEGAVPFESRQGNSLKSFVIRDVFYRIELCLWAGRELGIVTTNRAKDVETALLVSALLDEDVTNNDVTQVRGKERGQNVRAEKVKIRSRLSG